MRAKHPSTNKRRWKAVFLILAFLGIAGLWPAILADTGATLLVIMNPLRLLANGRTGNLAH